jgi:hypothetical protein
MYNAKGDRNFAVILDQDVAQQLANDGWNIKQLKPREDEDEPTPYLSVAVKMDGKRPPNIIMIGGDSGTRTSSTRTPSACWTVDIGNIDMVLRPFDWEVNGNTGRQGISAGPVRDDHREPARAQVREHEPDRHGRGPDDGAHHSARARVLR